MNSVNLIGRLTKDPEVKYGAESQSAYCRFSIAIDRGKDRNGEDMGADFPNIVCFGKTAENCEKFLVKGRLVAVMGKIRTGKYEDKDGKTVYTTDVYADRIEFLEWGDKSEGAEGGKTAKPSKKTEKQEVMPGFAQVTDDDIPF